MLTLKVNIGVCLLCVCVYLCGYACKTFIGMCTHPYLNPHALRATQEGHQDKLAPTSPMTELSTEQVEKIMVSEDFVTFVDRTSRLMERALCDSSDILFDYIIGDGEAEG